MTRYSRRNKNKHNRNFTLLFVEQTYVGASRTFSNVWNRYHRTVKDDKGGVLDREPGVRKALRHAHDWNILFDKGDADVLWTCINPTCYLRKQNLHAKNYIRTYVHIGKRLEARGVLRDELGKVAAGRESRLKNTCSHCSQKQHPYGVSNVLNKWVYVLKKQGDSLQPVQEIEFDEKGQGMVSVRLKGGEFLQKGRRNTSPAITLPRADIGEWHFFLSPVRLRKNSLKLLQDSLSKTEQAQAACEKAKPKESGVLYNKKLQPWATTCVRKFSNNALKDKPYEIIHLVDPFSWAAQIVDFDFAPILAAQFKLVRDPEEQAKAFIASTLQQAIGRKMISENPPKWTETDKCGIKDETVTVPRGARAKKVGNIAEAWTKRYRDTLEYLTIETNKACARLVFVLRYSLAHRIVELACQEADQEPGHLSLALTHWVHVLRELPAADTGARFIVWLTDPKAGSDDLDAGVRVPVMNVLKGKGIKSNTSLSKEVKGLPVLVLASLSAAVIARSHKPMQDMQQYLANINLNASVVKVPDGGEVLSLNNVKDAKNLAVSISGGVLTSYISKMPAAVNFSKAQRYSVAQNWSDRLKAFNSLAVFENIVSVLGGMKAFSKKPAKDGGQFESYKNDISKAKAAKSVAEFIGKSSRDTLSFGLSKTSKTAISTLEKKGRNAISTLTLAEYQALIGSRTARAYRLLGSGMRVLAGPVGILIGGAELVTTSNDAINAWDSNDPGKAVGLGLQAASGVLFIAVAGAECVALVTGAGAAAWAGPVGWIVAGLMLIGAIVISVWSKNDLELFSKHCFLGKEYGGGYSKSGKAWMMGKPYTELRYDGNGKAKDRFQRQRLALLRLLSGYKTWVGPSSFCGANVYPSFVLTTMCFQVEVDIMPKGKKSPKETVMFYYWPRSQKKVFRKGSATVTSYSNSNDAFSFIGDTDKVYSSTSLYDYEVRVRLDLDGMQREFLPASKSWVKNGSLIKGSWLAYHNANSAEVE